MSEFTMKSRENPMKWKVPLTSAEFKEMHPVLRSKYVPYMEPPPVARRLIRKIMNRLSHDRIMKNLMEQRTLMKESEREKVNIVIGRLKAAEARQRIHVVLMNLSHKVDRKLDQLVYVQPTGVHAVRTEYLVRNRPLEYLPGGRLNPVSDQREFYLSLTERSRLTTLMNTKII